MPPAPRAASSSCRRRCGGTYPGRFLRVTCSRNRRAPPLASGTTTGGSSATSPRAVLAVDAVLVAEPSIERRGERIEVRRGRALLELDEEHVARLRRPVDADVGAGAEVDGRARARSRRVRHRALDLDVRRELLRDRQAPAEAPHELDPERVDGREADDVAELVRVEPRRRRDDDRVERDRAPRPRGARACVRGGRAPRRARTRRRRRGAGARAGPSAPLKSRRGVDAALGRVVRVDERDVVAPDQTPDDRQVRRRGDAAAEEDAQVRPDLGDRARIATARPAPRARTFSKSSVNQQVVPATARTS